MVSVIVTTYNRKELLSKTLKAILDQTYKDFELIVVDNYSDYDFEKLIQQFNDKRIRAYRNQNNGIIATNRNYAIRKAKGEFLAFCDDDDIWYPNKLERCIEEIKSNDLIYHKLITNTGVIFESVNLYGKALQYLSTGNYIAYSSVFMRKEIAFKAGLLDEDPLLVAVEDYDFWLRISKITNKFMLIDEILGQYYIGNNNTSSNFKQVERLFNLYNKRKSMLPIKYRVQMNSYISFMAARKCHKKGQFYNAIKYYKNSIVNIYSMKTIIKSLCGFFLSLIRFKY